MKYLTPEKSRKITLEVMSLSALLCAFGYIADIALFCYIGFIAIILALVFCLLFYRCHACGKFLGRDKVEYCPHCGSKISD